MSRALFLHVHVLLDLTLRIALCEKFQLCGKSPGLLTASRGAAFASRYIQKCGKDIILSYNWTTPKLAKVAEKGCLGFSLCYAYSANIKKKSHLAFKQAVRQCLVQGMRALYIVKPVSNFAVRGHLRAIQEVQTESFQRCMESYAREIFLFKEDEFLSLAQHFNMCLRGDMLPMDVSVAQGLMRYFIKSSTMVRPNR